jgi:protein SCO1
MTPHAPSPPGHGREEAAALTGLIALFAITAAWWALALWPVQDGPAWLERTRYVCFGVAGSGLPDAGGWIGLIAGPLGMLAILLAGWWRGVRGLVLRARSSRVLAGTLAGLAAGCVLLAAGATVRVQQARAAPLWAEAAGAIPDRNYPRLDRPAPALRLTDQHGAAFDFAALRGRPALVTFAYAHCATICPLVVKHALDAQATLRGSSHEPVVIVVTLDPWRDTPSRLPGMAASWGLPADGAWILGGSVAAVEAALDAWEVPRSRNLTTGEVTHPSLTYIVDAAGVLAYASNAGTDALVALLRRI